MSTKDQKAFINAFNGKGAAHGIQFAEWVANGGKHPKFAYHTPNGVRKATAPGTTRKDAGRTGEAAARQAIRNLADRG